MRAKCLALVAVVAISAPAHADVFKDKKCVQIKNWMTGIPEGIDQFEGLLADNYFYSHFGSRYLELNDKQLFELKALFSGPNGQYCMRVWKKGNFTPQQRDLASQLFTKEAQVEWEKSNPLDPSWTPPSGSSKAVDSHDQAETSANERPKDPEGKSSKLEEWKEKGKKTLEDALEKVTK